MTSNVYPSPPKKPFRTGAVFYLYNALLAFANRVLTAVGYFVDA
jgi:hypothetical protein